MTKDRKLFEKLGKLLDAASNETEGLSSEYRDACFHMIWDKFWEVKREIKTQLGNYYDPDSSYEDDMKAVYNAYASRLWLIDVIDEINNDEADSE